MWGEDGDNCGLIVVCAEESDGCAVFEYRGVGGMYRLWCMWLERCRDGSSTP